VQKSPENPPAAWLWRPVPEILNRELHVRVGGSFVWPPPNVDVKEVKRVVFVAGGVGINPLMSIFGYLAQIRTEPYVISVLYSVRNPGGQGLSSILFLDRLAGSFALGLVKGEVVLHLTSGEKESQSLNDSTVQLAGWKMKSRRRRITKDDMLEILGGVDVRGSTVVYVCGVPAMTDELVNVAQKAPGMDPKKVLFERWW
jgi:NAD(P)H-flavin reductase